MATNREAYSGCKCKRTSGRWSATLSLDTVFVWAPGSHSDRVPFRGLNGRLIREVSRTEIGSVIDAHAYALANTGDPILVLSRLLGIARLSKDARAYLSDCTRWREGNTVEGTY